VRLRGPHAFRNDARFEVGQQGLHSRVLFKSLPSRIKAVAFGLLFSSLRGLGHFAKGDLETYGNSEMRPQGVFYLGK
jgi:hypothetical protein